MTRKTGRMTVITALAFSLWAASASAQDAARPTISIVAFDSDRTDWVPPPHMGETIADLLGDRLVSSHLYRVLDHVWLTGEEDRTPRVPTETLRDRAREAGVDYLVFGSITRFSTENRSRSGGGVLGLAKLIGGFHSTTTESVIALTVRVVDVRTGEIVATAVSNGNSSSNATSFAGGGIVRALPIGIGGSQSNGASKVALADESLVRAVDVAGAELVNAAPRLVKGGRD